MIRKNEREPRDDESASDADAAQDDLLESDARDGGSSEAEVENDLEALRDELDELNRKWLRALADLDNYKKRVERDRCRWAEAAREEVISDLLDVVDNFERALACENPGDPCPSDPFREGVELILTHLVDVLRKHGVEPINSDGCEFDPNVHEAVGHVESDSHESNQIVEETQKGYMLGDRLLRCSKVIVAK